MQESDSGLHCRTRRGVEEDINEILSGEEIQQNKRYAEKPHHFHACAKPAAYPRQLLRADVLRCKVRDSVSDRCQGSDDKVVELYRGGISGDDTRAKGVDDALNDDIPNRDEALLQNTRNRDDGDFLKHTPRKYRNLSMRFDGFETPEHKNNRKDTTDALAYERCPRNTIHASWKN